VRPRPTGGGRANPGRVAAVRTLMAVEEGQHAELALAQLAPKAGPDRGLAWNLVLGVLRRQGALDALLSTRLRQGINDVEPAVRAVLRAGLYDALLTRTPPHAAVHQAVEVCRAIGVGRASGLVNAVLRRLSSESLSDDPWLDLPEWLRGRWKDWGEWVARLGTPPPVCIVTQRPLSPDLSVTEVTLEGAAIDGVWALERGLGAIDALPGFAEGDWWVMDPAAVAVADLVATHTPDGGTVLDACAAPGGKAFRLKERGYQVVAVDQDPHRIKILQDNATRLAMTLETHAHQWSMGNPSSLGRFDTVLVDAPCTGLGIVRRHPEIRWRRLPSDPAAMGIRQRAILREAAGHVEDGGALIYAVCSPEPEEGPEVVAGLDGWKVVASWASTPPTGDEDAHQAFVLRREE